jgi:flagellar M-ring protein FliF
VVTKTALTKEELDRMTALVKEAVGFDATRGDTVNVTNADFTMPPAMQPLPEPPLWKQPWVIDIGKQLLGGLFALIVAFGVIRPAIKSLTRREVVVPANMPQTLNADGTLALPNGMSAGADGNAAALAGQNGQTPQLEMPKESSELERIRSLAAQDPKLAAQVVKGWVAAEG